MKTPPAIEETAAAWLVRRQAGFSPDERAEFQAWLAADPQHASALAELEWAWDTLNQPRRVGEADDVRRDLRHRARSRTQRRVAWGMGALACAAALMFTLQFHPRVAPSSPPVPTAVVKPDARVLADGSRVELNAGAEIAVEFSAERRDVRLLRGEALFKVTKDASRPFVVTASGVAVRAVGTEFAVRSSARQVDVLVTEGRVTIHRLEEAAGAGSATPSTAHHSVGAGEFASVPLAAEPTLRKTLSADAVAAALAWRNKRIEFSATPLSVAATMFNRNNRVQLALADEETGRLEITGIAWTDDPEGFVRLIESGLDLQAERAGDTITLRPAGAEKSR